VTLDIKILFHKFSGIIHPSLLIVVNELIYNLNFVIEVFALYLSLQDSTPTLNWVFLLTMTAYSLTFLEDLSVIKNGASTGE